MKRACKFDIWFQNHFAKYPEEWRKHKRGDTYTLELVELAFKAGVRAGKRTKA